MLECSGGGRGAGRGGCFRNLSGGDIDVDCSEMGDGVIFVTFVAPFVSGENDEKCIGVLVTGIDI